MTESSGRVPFNPPRVPFNRPVEEAYSQIRGDLEKLNRALDSRVFGVFKTLTGVNQQLTAVDDKLKGLGEKLQQYQIDTLQELLTKINRKVAGKTHHPRHPWSALADKVSSYCNFFFVKKQPYPNGTNFETSKTLTPKIIGQVQASLEGALQKGQASGSSNAQTTQQGSRSRSSPSPTKKIEYLERQLEELRDLLNDLHLNRQGSLRSSETLDLGKLNKFFGSQTVSEPDKARVLNAFSKRIRSEFEDNVFQKEIEPKAFLTEKIQLFNCILADLPAEPSEKDIEKVIADIKKTPGLFLSDQCTRKLSGAKGTGWTGPPSVIQSFFQDKAFSLSGKIRVYEALIEKNPSADGLKKIAETIRSTDTSSFDSRGGKRITTDNEKRYIQEIIQTIERTAEVPRSG